MRIAYFPNHIALNAKPVMDSLLQSCVDLGWTVEENSLTADTAVIWSVLWAGRMAANREIYYHYRNTGRSVICIEVGALIRGQTWKIALNHVNALGHYGHRSNLDRDRPKKLGISLQTNSLNHGRILVAGQHQRSLQVDGVDQEAWYVQKIQEIANGRQVVVRPHPRSTLNRSRFPDNVVWQTPIKLVNTYDSFDINWNYDAVINYNSGPGIQALIQGVPAIVDHTSLAYGVKDRDQWLIEICHTEYTVEEIRQGTWAKRIGLEN